MIRDLTSNKGDAKELAGALHIIDWLTSGETFENHALKTLGLLDLDHEPIQDYMSRDSDTQTEDRS